MISTDKFLSRVHKGAEYNCAHFVCEVWAELKGVDASKVLRGFLCAPDEMTVRLSDLRDITVLNAPARECVVLFQRDNLAHVGVLINGRVLHLPDGGSARYEPLRVAQAGFTRTRYLNV